MIVQELGQSTKGKPKAKIAGSWYFLASDKDTGVFINSPQPGQDIEIKSGSFQIDGKTFLTLEAWRPAGQATQSQPAQRQAPHQAAPTQVTVNYIEEASLRFISNVVGSAIVAKTITTPGQVSAWFNAAKAALEGRGADVPFSDEVPPMTDDNYEPTNTGRSNW